MTQINSYNGGAALPGDTVTRDEIKSLALQHNPTGEGQATDVVYSPLEGKTVPVRNLVIKDGAGNTVGIYDPLANAATEVEIPSGAVVVLHDTSNTISKAERDKLANAVFNNVPAFFIISSGSALTYYSFVKSSAGDLLFAAVSESEVKTVLIGRVLNPGDIYNITYGTTPLAPVVDTYIKKEALFVPGDHPWISWWAAQMGMSFGDILGAVCDKGDNKHYYGTIQTSIGPSGCIPCGCILFLDETEHPLESDECRNISINLSIILSGSGYDTEAEALSSVPESVWLRVFSVGKNSSGDKTHGPLKPSQCFEDGMFVDLDSVHFKRDAVYNTYDNKYYADAVAHITVSIIGSHWSHIYEG